MILYDSGKAYWEIVGRFNRHRDSALMRKVAVGDMQRLLQTPLLEPVKIRARNFVARNQQQSPGKPPLGTGPRRA